MAIDSRLSLNPPAIVEQDTRRATEVRKKIESLAQKETLTALELAKLLTEARQNDYHKSWGFTNFEDYVDQAKLGIGKRQAAYYVKIWEGADTLTIPEDELEEAGITKLKAIFSLDLEQFQEEIRDLVKRAPEMTVAQVNEEVKALKEGTDSDNFSWLNIPVLEENMEAHIKPAIELTKLNEGSTIDVHSKEGKDVSLGEIVTIWAQDYMQDPNNNADQMGEGGSFKDEIEVGGLPDDESEG